MPDEPSRDRPAGPEATAPGAEPVAAAGWGVAAGSPAGADPGAPRPVGSGPPAGPRRSVIIGAVAGALVGALVAGGVSVAFDQDTTTQTVQKVVGPAPVASAGQPASASPSASNNIAALVAQVEPAVVAITTQSATEQAAGTGFVISADGYIATNNHVVQGASTIQVQFTNGRTVAAQLVGRDASTDLAIVKVNGTNLPTVQLGDSNTVGIGDPVVAIGNALALQGGLSVTNGIISGLNRQVPESDGAVLVGVLQTDAAINPGNSGGPLLDAQGRVIGINTATADQAQNIGFAIPISQAVPVFNDLRSGKKPAFLGVIPEDLTPEIASQLNLTITQGAVITQVTSGTPAATAGLRRNDVIVQIDQMPIRDAADVQTAIRSHQPGDTIQIVVVRGAQRLTVTAKLTTRPSSAS